MGEFLNADQKASVQAALRYLTNGIAKPVDDILNEILRPTLSPFGFTRDMFRDDPVRTLLTTILQLNDAQDTGTAPTLEVAHAPDGDPDSPFPWATVTLTIMPQTGQSVVVQVSQDPTFNTGVATSVTIPQDNVSTIYIGVDTQAFFPGTYYFRAYATQHPTLYSNIVSYAVV